MTQMPFLMPQNIPDNWPGAPLQQTIAQHREFFENKRVLVTGACGFVGGHLARALHMAGADVVALDIRSARGSHLEMTGVSDEIEMVQADITDRRQMEELVTGGNFSHIFHLAAGATTVEKAMADPVGTIMANTMGFVNLAEGARLVPAEKRPVVIYSSTDKVYGEHEVLPYTEDHGLGGVGVYDAAKLCADILAATYHKALGVPTIVLRMCNIYGPYDFNFDYRLIPKAMRNIFRDGEAPELYMNSVEHFREYLFVEDAVRAYFHIARCQNCHGRVYNLPGALYASTPDVLREIVSHIGTLQERAAAKDPDSSFANFRWDRSIKIVPSDPNVITISKQHLDGTRIFNETGFEPKTSFHQGLAVTAPFYQWYFEHIAPAKLQQLTQDKDDAENDEQPKFDGGFHTVFTEDGLPVSVLNPVVREQQDYEGSEQEARPSIFSMVR